MAPSRTTFSSQECNRERDIYIENVYFSPNSVLLHCYMRMYLDIIFQNMVEHSYSDIYFNKRPRNPLPNYGYASILSSRSYPYHMYYTQLAVEARFRPLSPFSYPESSLILKYTFVYVTFYAHNIKINTIVINIMVHTYRPILCTIFIQYVRNRFI